MKKVVSNKFSKNNESGKSKKIINSNILIIFFVMALFFSKCRFVDFSTYFKFVGDPKNENSAINTLKEWKSYLYDLIRNLSRRYLHLTIQTKGQHCWYSWFVVSHSVKLWKLFNTNRQQISLCISDYLNETS